MPSRHVIVLAAGKGTRMRTGRPKVLHAVAGRSLIERVLESAATLGPDTTTVVVGHRGDAIRHALAPRRDLQFVVQEPQRGTAHALLQAESVYRGRTGQLIVLSGDVPRLRPATLRALAEAHDAASAAMTVLTMTLPQPFGYGRILRSRGDVVGIAEEADATAEQRGIREVNSGIYVFDLGPLFGALRKIPPAGPKQELYLPALLPLYRGRGLPIGTVDADDPDELRGINSQAELAEVSRLVRQAKNEQLMANGVTLEDPPTIYIDDDVDIGPDTVIHPGVSLAGRTTIGERCEIHAGTRIVDSVVGNDVTIRDHCVVTEARLDDGTRIGPFAHLRPGSVVAARAQVGNFVELKQSTLGPASKVNHLSYVGDTTIGRDVNVGAGTITCNYDGQDKHPTTIADGVFIGSGTQLVAPVSIGERGYVAAGSCITKDVPPGALAIARGRQAHKPDWVDRKRRK